MLFQATFIRSRVFIETNIPPPSVFNNNIVHTTCPRLPLETVRRPVLRWGFVRCKLGGDLIWLGDQLPAGEGGLPVPGAEAHRHVGHDGRAPAAHQLCGASVSQTEDPPRTSPFTHTHLHWSPAHTLRPADIIG